MMENRFTLEDFRSQLTQIKKMGPIGQLVGMIPGASQMAGAAQEAVDSGQMKRIEAIIDSMTPEERRRPELIKASRRRRIALGSGTSTAEVNRLLKQFVEMQKMMKMISRRQDAAAGRRPRRPPRSLTRDAPARHRARHPHRPRRRRRSSRATSSSSPRATDRAAALAPADTAIYVNVYLQPSTGQQMNLAGLIGRLPGFADDASLDEKVDQVVAEPPVGTGIDYRAEVKPWLGDQIAIAAWPVR